MPEKRFFDFAMWLLSLVVLLVILTSCNPYAGLTTPAPTVTATRTAQLSQAATISPTATPAPRVCIVSTGVPAGNLNIRTGAGVGFAVIGILHEGQALTLTDEPARAGWLQVTAGNVTGFINSKYCKIGE